VTEDGGCGCSHICLKCVRTQNNLGRKKRHTRKICRVFQSAFTLHLVFIMFAVTGSRSLPLRHILRNHTAMIHPPLSAAAIFFGLRCSRIHLFNISGSPMDCNKRSVAGGGVSLFYGKPALDFYTQTKTITSLWRRKHGMVAQASVNIPT
jgi:hypothetical protein